MKTLPMGNTPRPLGTVYCVGKNYADHVKEMQALFAGSEPDEPVIFSKPATSIIYSGDVISIPKVNEKPLGVELHHEVELVMFVGKSGRNLTEANASEHIAGFAIGLDMTLRDRQTAAKKSGTPWLLSKGFRTSGVLSPSFAASDLDAAQDLKLMLLKNGKPVQSGYTKLMIFKLPTIVSFLSHAFGLHEGDVIYTGTPSGIGPVMSGDRLEAFLLAQEGHPFIMENPEKIQFEGRDDDGYHVVLSSLSVSVG